MSVLLVKIYIKSGVNLVTVPPIGQRNLFGQRENPLYHSGGTNSERTEKKQSRTKIFLS